MARRGRDHPRNQIRAAARRGTNNPVAARNGGGNAAASLYPDNWDEIAAVIKRRDGYRCQIARLLRGVTCDVRAAPPFQHLLHVHHIVPLSKGGSNRATNLLSVCGTHHNCLHDHTNFKAITARQAIYVGGANKHGPR